MRHRARRGCSRWGRLDGSLRLPKTQRGCGLRRRRQRFFLGVAGALGLSAVELLPQVEGDVLFRQKWDRMIGDAKDVVSEVDDALRRQRPSKI
jgi:hypothetical protein